MKLLFNVALTLGWIATASAQAVFNQYGPATGVQVNTGLTPVNTAATSADILPLTHCAVNAQTGTTYTFVLSDADNCVTNSNTAAIVDTIPTHASVAFPVGTKLTIQQINTGVVTIAPAGGVTLNFGPNLGTTPLTLSGQWGSVTLHQSATDVWVTDAASGQAPVLGQLRLPYGPAATGQDANIVSNVTGPGSFGLDFGVGAGTATPTGASTCRNFRTVGNFYRVNFTILQNGDMQYCTGVANSVWEAQYQDQTANNVDRISFQNGTTFASGDGPGIGMTTNTSANCLARTGISLAPTISGPCSFLNSDQDGNAGYGLVIVYSPSLVSTVGEAFFGSNLEWEAIGNTTPVKWENVTSTGTSQASATFGDTNSGSTTVIQAASAALTLAGSTVTVTGTPLLPVSTVAGLPTCNGALTGGLRAVSDALGPTYGVAVVGGGAVGIPVYCDGTSWKSH